MKFLTSCCSCTMVVTVITFVAIVLFFFSKTSARQVTSSSHSSTTSPWKYLELALPVVSPPEQCPNVVPGTLPQSVWRSVEIRAELCWWINMMLRLFSSFRGKCLEVSEGHLPVYTPVYVLSLNWQKYKTSSFNLKMSDFIYRHIFVELLLTTYG